MEEKQQLIPQYHAINEAPAAQHHVQSYKSVPERKYRVDDVLNFIGYGPLQTIAFVMAGLTAISYGIEAVIFAFIDIPVQNQWNLTNIEYAVLPSTTGVANIVGGIIYPLMCDRYGRVWPYALVLANIGVFGLASAFSPNFISLIVFRNLVSVGTTGSSSVLFPTLVEFLPTYNRGKVMISVVIIQALGVCATGGLAWWLLPAYEKNGWRYLIIATSIPQFITMVYRLVFPLQSPRYLIARGEYSKARRVFAIMARINRKNINDILPESKELQEVVEMEDKSDVTCVQFFSSLLTMFKPPFLRTTIFLTIIFLTETTAYYASSLFLPQVLQDLGTSPYFTAFVGYLGQIPGILLISIIAEWRGVGRLNSLRFFSLLSVASFLLFAFVRNEIATSVSTVLVYFSMVPMLSLLYTYVSEIYPTMVRSFAFGYYNNFSALFGIAVPFCSGWLASVHIYWLYPTVWAGIFFVQFVVSLFLNRETLGRSLIDRTERTSTYYN